MKRIYLDYAATTPVDPRVVEHMLPYLTEHFGNPSSLHATGRQARRAVEDARDLLAALLRCEPTELIFTSGGTESDNSAILGIARAQRQVGKGNHIVTSRIEHHAVLHACQHLETQGFAVTYVPVDAYGRVDPASVAAAIRPETVLVTVMLANNEVGTVQPLEAIARLCRERGIPVHTDAVQAAGQLPLDLGVLEVDALSLTAHKFYGPKGIGLLYLRQGTPYQPPFYGGGQEREQRPGTEHVAGIVGMAEAFRLAVEELSQRVAHARAMRDQLEAGIRLRLPWARANGHPTERVANNSNWSFPGVSGETLLMRMDLAGIAVSNGSACTAGTVEPSHVLLAMGLPEELAGSALRFSTGMGTTPDDIEITLDVLTRVAEELQQSHQPQARAAAMPAH
jgi:cysteine desulfurase